MGKYSFGYTGPEQNGREQSFCYDRKSIEEYYFTYGRDRKSDTSKFNDLVPVIKNRARSFYLDPIKWGKKFEDLDQFEKEKWLEGTFNKAQVESQNISLRITNKKARTENNVSISPTTGILINSSVWKEIFLYKDIQVKSFIERKPWMIKNINQGIYNSHNILMTGTIKKIREATKPTFLTYKINKKNFEIKESFIPIYKKPNNDIIISKRMLSSFVIMKSALIYKGLTMERKSIFKGDVLKITSGEVRQRDVFNIESKWIVDPNKKTTSYFDTLFSKLKQKSAVTFSSGSKLEKVNKAGSYLKGMSFLNFFYKKTMTVLKTIFSSSKKKGLNKFYEQPMTYRDSKSFVITKQPYFLNKDKFKVNKWNSITSFKKDNKNFSFYDVKYGGEKHKVVGSIFNGILSGTKAKVKAIKNDDSIFGVKSEIEIVTNFDKFVIKDGISLNFLLNESSSDGYLLPLKKDRLVLNTYEPILFGIPEKNYLNLLDDIYVSKIPIVGNIIPNITDGLSKKRSQTFIDYTNEVLKKCHVNGTLNTNILVNKNRKELSLLKMFNQISKGRKEFVLNNLTYQVSKFSKETYLSDNLFADKETKQTKIHDILYTLLKQRKSSATPENILAVDRAKKGIDKFVHTEMSSSSREIIKFKNKICVRANDEIQFFDDYTNNSFKKEIQDFEINNSLVLSKSVLARSSMANTLNTLQKVLKDLDVPEDNNVTWAWVYELPDPFENVWAGIDELLIPETDTRYENFEEIIFDKKRLIPKNPVKQIDDNTWIAKYPIKHPLPEYSDLGLEYVEIENGLMKHIFLEFYRIWQKNIFKFGGMDMVKSVELIIEYLYAWIILYMPEQYKEQAFRVLKMIRWYGEASIIQNSQYIITYEMEDLKSNLHTGTCDIPYFSNNMEISKEDAVFMTTEINKDSWTEFYVRNTKETTISFSVISTVGTVFIYINDELVDTISGTAKNLTYKLEYAYPENKIRIEKPKDHNRNKDFYIGFIIVKESAAGNLKIEYDPRLKAGNKPLDEIARKMIAYANLYENNQEVFETLRKGNLGVSEIYKRLQEYWDLHHMDKEKGKRLTIKEV